LRGKGGKAGKGIAINDDKRYCICRDVADRQSPKPTVTLREDGLYDILSRVDLLDEQLPETAELECTLDIPRANYTVSRKTVYYSG